MRLTRHELFYEQMGLSANLCSSCCWSWFDIQCLFGKQSSHEGSINNSLHRISSFAKPLSRIHRTSLHHFNDIRIQDISVLLTELISMVGDRAGIVLDSECRIRNQQRRACQSGQFLNTRVRLVIIRDHLLSRRISYVKIILIGFICCRVWTCTNIIEQ